VSSVIVGAGPGMGRAIAAAIAPQHGPVGLIARRPARLAEVIDALRGSGVDARPYPADITDDTDLRAALGRARAELGPFSVVVYNASQFVAGPPTRTPLDEFREGLATGITGALVALQATASDLLRLAPASALLFTGSGLALAPWSEGVGLSIQKAGLRHLALAAAAELRPQGVSVSLVTIAGTIEPGGPFDPDRLAAIYADLATPGRDRPVEVTVTADGPAPGPAA
jgi:NAD(P)-dependent dehydrogenase (short-subunit alcohol dehydrogenase family)